MAASCIGWRKMIDNCQYFKVNTMEIKIKTTEGLIDATIETVNGVMIVSPKKVKFEPKDGDVSFHDGMIYIFKGVKPSSMLPGKSAIIHHCYYDGEILEVKEGVGCGYIDCSQRPATEEEKQKLFNKLKEEGYEWDAEKKELVKLKWKPKVGEDDYTPFCNEYIFEPYLYGWDEDESDLKYHSIGWVFKTKEECQAFCDKLNQAIEGIKP